MTFELENSYYLEIKSQMKAEDGIPNNKILSRGEGANEEE